jgi:transposase-like protein
MAAFKRTQRDYPLSFKISVVEQIEKSELTYKQAQRRYGIQGCSTVLTWLHKHGHPNWDPGLTSFASQKLPMNQPPAPLTPEQRIKELEEQLEFATQKAKFLLSQPEDLGEAQKIV